ncbi:hypothetical protein D3C81_1456570 [compost metagenome]
MLPAALELHANIVRIVNVIVLLVELRQIDEVGFARIIVPHRTPERGQALLAIQQVLIDATVAGTGGLDGARLELLLVAHFQQQRHTDWQVLDDGIEEAADTAAVPGLEALEARQPQLARFNALVPVAKLAVAGTTGDGEDGHAVTSLISALASGRRSLPEIRWGRRVSRSVSREVMRSRLTAIFSSSGKTISSNVARTFLDGSTIGHFSAESRANARTVVPVACPTARSLNVGCWNAKCK